MVARDDILPVLELYEKHGWTPRRALVTGDAAVYDDIIDASFVKPASVDALWFSRVSKPGTETWELRRLTGSPFALVAVFDDGHDEDERESLLAEIEHRMQNAAPRGTA